VLVEQHLHFALQAVQGPGQAAVGQPGADVGARHARQRGAARLRQHRALHMPVQRVVPAQLQAVFGQPGLHGLHELLRFVVLQAQQLGRQHHHLVHADLPVAGGDPGLRACAAGFPGGPGPWACIGPAQGLRQMAFGGQQGVGALVAGVAQARQRLQACEQLAQLRQRLAVGQVLGPVAAGG